MKKHNIALPVISLIAATRGMLGAGIGLLMAPRLRKERRRAVGWTLLAVGAVTTVPLVMAVLNGNNHDKGVEESSSGNR